MLVFGSFYIVRWTRLWNQINESNHVYCHFTAHICARLNERTCMWDQSTTEMTNNWNNSIKHRCEQHKTISDTTPDIRSAIQTRISHFLKIIISIKIDVNNFEVSIVVAFHTHFGIFTNQTINHLMANIICRLIDYECNQRSQAYSVSFKMRTNSTNYISKI